MARFARYLCGSFVVVLLLVNTFVATPPAASAQEAAVPLPAPVPIVRPDIGTRQTLSPSPGGITEQGRGVVSLPADRLRLTIRVFAANVRPGGSDAPASADLEKSALDVMRSSGISDARLATPVLGNFNGGDIFVGSIEKPTHDKLVDVEQRIVSKLPASALPLLRNVNITGSLEVDDCAAAVNRARIAAVADARERATALAEAVGSHLGVLVAASESDQTAGCADQKSVAYFANGNNDLLDRTTVDVAVSLSATFAIRP